MRPRALHASLLLTFIALSGCIGGPEPGERAPDFEVTTLEGDTIRLREMAGTPVVLFFAGTVNCISCEIETKRELVPLHDELGDSVRFLTIGIVSYETEQDIRDFAERTGASWPHAKDRAGIALDYNAYALGHTVVLDDEQRIRLVAVDPPAKHIRAALEDHI